MTPDSMPIIGATQYANLWLNTGHGIQGEKRRALCSRAFSTRSPVSSQ